MKKYGDHEKEKYEAFKKASSDWFDGQPNESFLKLSLENLTIGGWTVRVCCQECILEKKFLSSTEAVNMFFKILSIDIIQKKWLESMKFRSKR